MDLVDGICFSSKGINLTRVEIFFMICLYHRLFGLCFKVIRVWDYQEKMGNLFMYLRHLLKRINFLDHYFFYLTK